MTIAGGNADHMVDAADLHRRAAIDAAAVAQLAGRAAAPRPDGPVRPECDAEPLAGGDRGHLIEPGYDDRLGGGDRRAVAEVADHVAAPGADGPVDEQGEIVTESG